MARRKNGDNSERRIFSTGVRLTPTQVAKLQAAARAAGATRNAYIGIMIDRLSIPAEKGHAQQS